MEKIKAKITKLLALSSSPNEAEAASALSKAKILLSRNNLTINDLEQHKKITENTMEKVEKLSPWEERLLQCIADATYTEIIKVYINEIIEIRIIGKESNIIIAKILHEYLSDILNKKANLFKDSINDIESFRLRMIESINEKLKKNFKSIDLDKLTKEIIIVVENSTKIQNKKYINKKYGETEKSDNWYGIEQNSFGLGKSIGKRIPVNYQLKKDKNL